MRGFLNGKQRKRGFTLIELLVVILILAILAALIVPRVIGRTGEAKRAKAETDIQTLMNAVQQFRLDTDRYPTTEEGLAALRTSPPDARNWKGPYVERAIPNDPWGGPYQYDYAGGDSPVIYSFGADNVEGGDGDNADISSDGGEGEL